MSIKEGMNEYHLFSELLAENKTFLKAPPRFEMNFIPSYLKKLRLSKKISLRKVAAKTGLSDTYISLIESEKRPLPKLETLEKICDVYDIKLLELFTMYELEKSFRLLNNINEEFPIDVKKLITNYSKLNAENKKMVNKFLSFLLEHN